MSDVKAKKPPTDTTPFYVEMDERDINFLATVVKGYDGIAHVRRDWIVREGKRWVKILVPIGFEDEIQQVLHNMSKYIRIGSVRTDFDEVE